MTYTNLSTKKIRISVFRLGMQAQKLLTQTMKHVGILIIQGVFYLVSAFSLCFWKLQFFESVDRWFSHFIILSTRYLQRMRTLPIYLSRDSGWHCLRANKRKGLRGTQNTVNDLIEFQTFCFAKVFCKTNISEYISTIVTS